MKRMFSSFFMLLITVFTYAQAYEGTVDYQRSQQPAAVIELPYAPDIVKAAMNDYLSKKGRSKGNDLRGFSTFRNTLPMPGDSVNADLYFKVERKSRKEKQNSIISLLLTTPKEGQTGTNNMHYLNMEEAKTYLNDLAPAIEAYNLELQIKDQNEAVIKEEAKYKKLADEGKDLEKKRLNIEKKIEENKQEQQKQMNEVENQKQKLAVKVSERKL